jgi:hypothetical protein
MNRRAQLSIRDAILSPPKIEHFNNYTRNGRLINAGASKQKSTVPTEPLQVEKKDMTGVREYKPIDDSISIIESILQCNKSLADHNFLIKDRNGEVVLLTDIEQVNNIFYMSSLYRMKTEAGESNWFTLNSCVSNHLEITRIRDSIIQGVRDFKSGDIEASEVTNMLHNAYKDYLTYHIALGFTDGNDVEFNKRLLSHVQATFMNQAGGKLSYDMWQEGLEHAKSEFGWTDDFMGRNRFVYYNAKFYHAFNDLINISDSVFANMAKREGFTEFDVFEVYRDYPHARCFNTSWNGGAMGIHAAKMTNTSTVPPKDFIMFYAPSIYRNDDLLNGTMHEIAACDPSSTGGHNCQSFFIRVPRGQQLFKPGTPLWLLHSTSGMTWFSTTDKNFNYKIGAAYNITSFLKPGADFQNSLEELFAKYINTFVGTGALTLWQNGVRVDHDASFSVFNEKRMFYGSEFADADAKSNFIDNFEFHMFLQW